MPKSRTATGKQLCVRGCSWPITTPSIWESWCYCGARWGPGNDEALPRLLLQFRACHYTAGSVHILCRLVHQTSENSFRDAAKGPVGRQISPGCSPLRSIKAAGLSFRQAFRRLFLDLRLKLLIQRIDSLQVFMKRVAPAP